MDNIHVTKYKVVNTRKLTCNYSERYKKGIKN